MRRFIALALSIAALTATPARSDTALAIAGTMARDGDYGQVLEALDDVHADATTLSLYWDDLERDGVWAVAISTAPAPNWRWA